MASDMKAYLAAKYMSGPKADAILARTDAGPKKKKRKLAPAPSAIRDDDLPGWGAPPADDDDDAADAVVASDRRFKRAQDGGSWATVRAPDEPEPEPADEQPLVVQEKDGAFKGGLLTAAQLKTSLPRARGAQAESAAERAAAQETVYRDASGRKVDVAAERAEAASKKREAEEREARKMEWGKGVVQRAEQERRRDELAAVRGKAFARTADDVEMNAELKAKELWNDPAAAFLTKDKKKGPRRPEYTGPPPPPNRFGIKPGYRWDGVDRSNGFEKKLFQRHNERRRRTAESYEWSVDDM